MKNLAENDPEIKTLSDSLVKEIIRAAGLPKTATFQRIFDRLFHRATERLATIGITTDRLVANSGLSKAAEWMHSNFCKDVTVRGKETIPPDGPLLIVSNHSGTYDSLVLASQIGREDLQIIASDIPFFKKLPNIARHLIFLSDNTVDRMTAARAGIRHLQKGGAFLIFGTGRIDPDPEVYPQADRFIERWSPSIDLFLKAAPDARVLISIISGVLSNRWGHHPLTWLRRIDWEKRRLAEFGQVILQLFAPGTLYLTPHVSFAPPVTVETLRRESSSESLLPAVINRGKALLAEHCQRFDLCSD
jgi:1-acyl-sn-glycerol-3-phosphate acyltransferase